MKTTTFDCATLGSSHKINFSWQLLDIFLAQCDVEIEITNAADFRLAQDCARIIQSMLYVEGISPFIMPIVMSHGLRDYSGINARDSTIQRRKLPTELQTGFTTKDGQIEGWIHDPTLACITKSNSNTLSSSKFLSAANAAERWKPLEKNYHVLSVARRAMQTAPMIPDLSSSLIHIWQGIEALFPSVSSEISYRLSLLISQLCLPVQPSRTKTYTQARMSYNKRSRAAHGHTSTTNHGEWLSAWEILTLCISACIHRDALPTEEALTLELLD